MTTGTTVLATLLATAAVVLFGARWIERALMYHPSRERVSPAEAGLLDVEEIEFPAADGARVLAWWAKAQPGQPTLLYFHGNGGSLYNRSERIRKYMDQGRGVFMMTYRGYGGSAGTPSEQANVADAMAAYDTLVARGVTPEDIVLYGESLGSGIAVQVAAAKPVSGLILDAPYTSIVDVARLHYPLLPSSLLMRDRYETLRYIESVEAPLLIVHGEADTVIPVAMGRTVFAAAKGLKEIVTVPGAGHSDHGLFGSYDAIQVWLERLRVAHSRPGRVTGRAGR